MVAVGAVVGWAVGIAVGLGLAQAVKINATTKVSKKRLLIDIESL
jgi:hypothetical protein